jgi:hypothetical protein
MVVISIVGSIPMSDFDLCGSSATIPNVVIDTIQDDTVFVVGDQGYDCPRLMAVFFCRISLSRSVDASIAEYIVHNPNSNHRVHFFMSLGRGSTIPVTPADRDFFLSLSVEFEPFYVSRSFFGAKLQTSLDIIKMSH